MAEWSAYDFAISDQTSAELAEVYHVAHLRDARKIADDGLLTARPIYDTSRLNKTRTHVCWASGNTWSQGSIYGTIKFTFPWEQIVSGKNIYWIEAMEDYHPTAFRFLITDREKPMIPEAVLYDPITSDGPLKKKNDKWFRNTAFTSEFMIEGNLELKLCNSISFIPHHKICRLRGSSCDDKSFPWTASAARFVGYLIGTQNVAVNRLIIPASSLSMDSPDTMMLRGAVSGFWTGIGSNKERFTGAISNGSAAQYIFRASALQYAMGDIIGARETASLLASQEVFEGALKEVLAKHFDMPPASFFD